MRRRFSNYEDFVKSNLLKFEERQSSIVTVSLILFLSIIYLIEVFYLSQNQDLFNSLITNPMHLLEGNYYSIFTSIFLHADLFHLLSNCLALFVFGRVVEKHLKFKTLFVFIASGLIANLVSHTISLMTGDIFSSLGASGAIAGLIIFAIFLEPLEFTRVLIIPIPIFIFGWLLISSDLIGLTNPSNVNHFAHLGGYLALLVLFFFMGFSEKRKLYLGAAINLTIFLISYILIKVVSLEKIKLFLGL